MGREGTTKYSATKLGQILNMLLRVVLAGWIAAGVLTCPVSCLCEASDRACTLQAGSLQEAEPASLPADTQQRPCSCQGLNNSTTRQNQKEALNRAFFSQWPACFLAAVSAQTDAVTGVLREQRRGLPDNLWSGVTLRFAISSLLL